MDKQDLILDGLELMMDKFDDFNETREAKTKKWKKMKCSLLTERRASLK